MINEVALKQIEDIKNKCETIKPLVAIRCITYNHEPYLRDALEGFVMQKTDFPFVAIVHDDASTDKTADIIKEYAERYPDIILPIYEEENQYAKNITSLRNIMDAAINATGAEYMALCEGDDYWIDPLKLQKQILFLSNHPDYSITFHNTKVLNLSKGKFIHRKLVTREYLSDEVFLDWIIPTASIVIRNLDYSLNPPKDIINGDIWLVLKGLNHGKGMAFEEAMSTYRVLDEGVTIKRLKLGKSQFRKKYLKHHKILKKIFPKITQQAYRKKQAKTNFLIGIELVKEKKIEFIIYFIKSFIYHPYVSIKWLFLITKSKFDFFL